MGIDGGQLVVVAPFDGAAGVTPKLATAGLVV